MKLTIGVGIHIVPPALGRHITLPARREMTILRVFSRLRCDFPRFLLTERKKG